MQPNMFTNNSFEIGDRQNPAYHSPTTLPQPTGLPWNIQEMTWGTPSPPSVVQFTGNSPTPSAIEQNVKMKYTPGIKRKSNEIVSFPMKQLKTDEAMAAHLDLLHISTDFTSHNKSDESELGLDYEDFSLGNGNSRLNELQSRKQITDIHRIKNVEKIVLCKEMLQLQADSILPQTLLNRLEKPCMSLVLWRPPEKVLHCDKDIKSNDKSDMDRPSVLVNDTYAMDVEL